MHALRLTVQLSVANDTNFFLIHFPNLLRWLGLYTTGQRRDLPGQRIDLFLQERHLFM
ncbi:hypothetical protein BN8_06474 [Fibrisoma limi BUZ 3]|uniref:Uncharacterized protein n=1 Tax=Fibrisoma limi BUZ 3 TaxID=1185876 RepID=I2GT44_9BACT|nr:hypothetical protein BN8_06474 [Fibrisoma limi BUZ 3]